MGDLANMMTDGTLCSCCGSFIDKGDTYTLPGDEKQEKYTKDTKDALGYPVLCEECEEIK